MAQSVMRVVSTVTLGYTLALLPVLCAADEPTPAKPAPAKAPDFSKYVTVADVVGEVVKADGDKITLRITWFVPQTQGGNKNNNNHRPPLSANNRNFRNPYAHNMNRPQQPKVTFKEQHHDYELEYVPESLVRTKILTPKMNENGKRADYTTKELQDLRAPAGFPGYAASPYDLTPGTIVEVVLVRDKSIAAAKATEDDLRVKYAVIQGKDPNPPKDIANPKTEKKDKKAK
jgi:hypothetical protein